MINVISLFSGGGGIDAGFHNAGFNIVYSTDLVQDACNTILMNNPNQVVDCVDIRQINFKELKDRLNIQSVDCLVGGPPCPAYSKSRFYRTEKKRALEDENSFTLKEYFRAIEQVKPRVFFFENVHGFIYKPHQDAFLFLKEMSEKLNYEISWKVVNAANYGVPQTRERFICVGVSKELGKKFIFPEETHRNPELFDLFNTTERLPWVTCGDVLNDIDYELPEDEKLRAGSKHKDLLELIPPGDNYLFFTAERGYPSPIFKWRSRYWSFLLKLSPDRPSWTIQASFSNNMGPFHWKNRFLRIQEIKRIQTFRDDYVLDGDFRSQWRQIGNAVPPLLVEKFAASIKEQLFTNTN
ncbi:DNA cytosine methyltransferase [Cohnella sp. JJ-181]|uniref:DNA cytosine methyltransferase n=1 Tax=Cohnella rhizoplanae TaxID=2974897 RepID=UPI0022FFB28D|nr:DNA (cytosine-5-)-methyltransferase [Cohnella sp. JJ-181]CAI6086026.1 Modification methylase BspRI [Cohnella sp. JJ-181]